MENEKTAGYESKHILCISQTYFQHITDRILGKFHEHPNYIQGKFKHIWGIIFMMKMRMTSEIEDNIKKL